jgi:lysophospholipase L1-like esterase
MVKGITIAVLLTAVAVAGLSQQFSSGKRRAMIDGMTERRLSQFEALSATHAAVVFVGDSITEGGLWSEWLPGVDVINRGISGNTTQDILDRMPHIVSVRPDKLFLMIGVNDLNKRLGAAVALRNYTTLFDLIDAQLPNTEVYIQSVLPVNAVWPLIDNTHIPTLNAALARHADERGYRYIDLHSVFADAEGALKPDLSNDGIHLLAPGYRLWRGQIIEFL